MTGIELVAVGAVVVIGLAVVVLKSRQDRAQRLRRGSSTGYFDRDMARYVQNSGGAAADGQGDPSVRSVSPTFSSSPKGAKGRPKGRKQASAPAPRTPMPVPSFAVPDLAHAIPVPAFDQVAAQQLGPSAKMPPPPPSSVPPPPPPPRAAGPGGAPPLPTFAPSTPPPPPSPEDPTPS